MVLSPLLYCRKSKTHSSTEKALCDLVINCLLVTSLVGGGAVSQPKNSMLSSSEEVYSDSTGNDKKSVHWAFFHIAVVREVRHAQLDFLSCVTVAKIDSADVGLLWLIYLGGT